MLANAFQVFSAQHGVTLVIGFAVIALLLVMARHSDKGRMRVAALLIFLNLSAYAYSQAAWSSLKQPVSLDNALPFHLCDLSAIIAGFALITRRQLLCELTYCWGLAATAQALLTPALGIGFPSWPFLAFFVQHFAIVAAALYLPIVVGWRPRAPRWKTPLIALGCGVGYQLLSLAINAWLGSNFGFSMRPPDNPSLLDHLGPWPWYLIAMWPIAFVLFLLICLPLGVRNRSEDSAA